MKEAMLTIYFSPHMTSVDNEAGRASGHADVPLSSLGREQARELGKHYVTKTLDAVFCSDLQRASTTGEIAFSVRQLPLMLDARLRECDYGELTQCSRAQMETEFPRRIHKPFPGGESIAMVVRRVGAFLQDSSATYDGKTIAIIGHRATKYALRYWQSDATLEELVHAPEEWLDVPVYRYEIHRSRLAQRAIEL